MMKAMRTKCESQESSTRKTIAEGNERKNQPIRRLIFARACFFRAGQEALLTQNEVVAVT